MKARKESESTSASVVYADLLGAHMSAAGGVAKAVERAEEIGCTALQVFTRNPSQWSSPPLSDDAIRAFRKKLATSPVRFVASHDAYLINLASPDAAVRARSIGAMLDEVDRAALLGIPVVVTHLGGHMSAGEDAGLATLVESLDRVADARPESPVRIALETTAGMGTSLGARFEHIAYVRDHVQAPERLAVCFDTCHVHVAGYDLSAPDGIAATWGEFDAVVGLKHLVAIHMNDAKKGRGSRVDRHEHIGKGTLGETPFAWIMKCRMFADVPKIVETPESETMHRENVARLRQLASS